MDTSICLLRLNRLLQSKNSHLKRICVNNKDVSFVHVSSLRCDLPVWCTDKTMFASLKHGEDTIKECTYAYERIGTKEGMQGKSGICLNKCVISDFSCSCTKYASNNNNAIHWKCCQLVVTMHSLLFLCSFSNWYPVSDTVWASIVKRPLLFQNHQ